MPRRDRRSLASRIRSKGIRMLGSGASLPPTDPIRRMDVSERPPDYQTTAPAEPTCNDCGQPYWDHRYAKCGACISRLIRVANGSASPADLAAYLGYTALKLAASLAEFPDDPAASAEWAEYLGDAEHRLDRALGLTDEQVPTPAQGPGLRLGIVPERRLRAWPKDRIRPKSIAIGVISLLAEVDALRAERREIDARTAMAEEALLRTSTERDDARRWAVRLEGMLAARTEERWVQGLQITSLRAFVEQVAREACGDLDCQRVNTCLGLQAESMLAHFASDKLGRAILEAAEAMAQVLGPAVDFIQIFESENAQNLALLMAMQLAQYRALVPAPPATSEARS